MKPQKKTAGVYRLTDWIDSWNGPFSRLDASKGTGLARQSLSHSLVHLTKHGLLKRSGGKTHNVKWEKTAKWDTDKAKQLTIQRMKAKAQKIIAIREARKRGE